MQPQIVELTYLYKRDCSGSSRFFIGTITESPTNIKKSYRHCFPKTDISFYLKNRFKLKRHYLEVLEMSCSILWRSAVPAILQVLAALRAFHFIGLRNKGQFLGLMQPQIVELTYLYKRDCSGSSRFFIGTITESPANIKQCYIHCFPKK